MRYAEGVARRIAAVAAVADAPVKALDADWFYEVRGDRLHYRDARGAFDTPLPGLPGPHQPGNLALAIGRYSDSAMREMRARRPAPGALRRPEAIARGSEEHTSELQSLMRISYAVFCLKNTKTTQQTEQ